MTDPDDAKRAEGWESLAEESAGALAPSPELEEALREAEAAVEAREAEREARAKEPSASARELEALREEKAGLEERLVRLTADFENHRKRVLREKQLGQIGRG